MRILILYSFILFGLLAKAAPSDFVYSLMITPKFKFGETIENSTDKLQSLGQADLSQLYKRAEYLGENNAALKILWTLTQRHINLHESDEIILADYIKLINLEIKLGNYILADKIVTKGLTIAEKNPKQLASFIVEFTQLKALLYFETEHFSESENQFELAQEHIKKHQLLYSIADAHKLINEAKSYKIHGRFSTTEILLLRAKRILLKIPEEKLSLMECNFSLMDNYIALNNKDSYSVLRDETLEIMKNGIDTLHPYFDLLKTKDFAFYPKNSFSNFDFIKSKNNLSYSFNNNSKELFSLYVAYSGFLNQQNKLQESKNNISELLLETEKQYPANKIHLSKIEYELAKIEFYLGNNKASLTILKNLKT